MASPWFASHSPVGPHDGAHYRTVLIGTERDRMMHPSSRLLLSVIGGSGRTAHRACLTLIL